MHRGHGPTASQYRGIDLRARALAGGQRVRTPLRLPGQRRGKVVDRHCPDLNDTARGKDKPAPRSARRCPRRASSATASSRSTKTVAKRPDQPGHRSTSPTKLVFPIRRRAVTSVWVPSSARSRSAAISTSRSKKRSPSTRFPPALPRLNPHLPSESLPTILLPTEMSACCLRQSGLWRRGSRSRARAA